MLIETLRCLYTLLGHMLVGKAVISRGEWTIFLTRFFIPSYWLGNPKLKRYYQVEPTLQHLLKGFNGVCSRNSLQKII